MDWRDLLDSLEGEDEIKNLRKNIDFAIKIYREQHNNRESEVAFVSVSLANLLYRLGLLRNIRGDFRLRGYPHLHVSTHNNFPLKKKKSIRRKDTK